LKSFVWLYGGDDLAKLRFLSSPDIIVRGRIIDISPFCALQEAGLPTWVESLDKSEWTQRARTEADQLLPETLSPQVGDRLIIDLTGVLMNLFLAPSESEETTGGRLFSAVTRETCGSSSLLYDKADHGEVKMLAPGIDELEPELSELLWNNFHRFTEYVMTQFASKNIILVRSQVHLSYCEHMQVRSRQKGPALVKARTYLDHFEDYFQQETKCVAIRLAERWLPCADKPLEDTSISTNYLYELQAELCRCLAEQSARSDRLEQPVCDCLAEALYLAAQTPESSAVETANPEVSGCCPEHGGSVFSIETGFAAAASMTNELSDRDNKLDWPTSAINRLPFALSSGIENDMLETNTRTLAEYQFSRIDKKQLDQAREIAQKLIVLRLNEGRLLRIRQDTSGLDIRRVAVRNLHFSWRAIVNAGYVFELRELFSVLGSWQLFFERARRGETAPLVLRLKDTDELATVLAGIDLADLLSNENIVIELRSAPAMDQEFIDVWHARTDLSLLFKDGTFLVGLRSGLGDQFFYYSFACLLLAARKDIARTPILDDLLFDDDPHVLEKSHVQPALSYVPEEPGMLRMSQLVSVRLRVSRCKVRKGRLRDDRSEYYALGLSESMLVTHHGRLGRMRKQRLRVNGRMLVLTDCAELFEWFGSDWWYIPVMDVYPYNISGYYPIALKRKRVLEKATTPAESMLPVRVSDVASLMLAHDSIIMHVRRGDYIAEGLAERPDQYHDALLELTEDVRHNGHDDLYLFVFSDDMAYVHEHENELGISAFPDDRVHFVENDPDPMTDWNLMRLGAFVIAARSGYVTTAALASTHVQAIYGFSPLLDGKVWKRPIPKPKPPSTPAKPKPSRMQGLLRPFTKRLRRSRDMKK